MRGSLLVSQQVRILLERMDMYPQEFVHPFELRHIEPKWHGILHNGGFNRLEKFLIKRKYTALRRKATQQMIMDMILDGDAPQENDDDFITISTTGRAAQESDFK
jgi:hypothetical protein